MKKTVKVPKWTRCMHPPPHRQFLNGFVFSQDEIIKQLKYVRAIGKDAKKCERFGKAICEFAEAYVGSMLRLAKMSPLKRMEINESSSVDVILNMTADKKLEHALKVFARPRNSVCVVGGHD